MESLSPKNSQENLTTTDISISSFDMVASLSTALDLIDPKLINHHKRVCYIATSLASFMGFAHDELQKIYLASILHDIGAIAFEDRLNSVEFEYGGGETHGILGAKLLLEFSPLANLAPLVMYHHTWWDHGKGKLSLDQKVPYTSHLIHLADRIAILVNDQQPILSQISEIEKDIIGQSDKMFSSEFVSVFLKISKKNTFWLDLASPNIGWILGRKFSFLQTMLGLDDLSDWSRFFAVIIDTRSRFTATHSSGVAATAQKLASLFNFSALDCKKMEIAGHLHDIGKLAVPNSILEKSGQLNTKEWRVVHAHSYYTHSILDQITGFEEITRWASNHHETLDGRGYPFGHSGEELCIGSRIMMVADIFTALAEDRPYRKGLNEQKIQNVFFECIQKNKLDPLVTEALLDNYEIMNCIRIGAQVKEAQRLQKFWETATSHN